MARVRRVGGPAALGAARAAAGGMALVGVTVRTSHEAGDFERVVGRGVPDLGFEAERLGRLAVAAGLRGGGAAGHALALPREMVRPDARGVGPGGGAPGEGPGGQAPPLTRAGAV